MSSKRLGFFPRHHGLNCKNYSLCYIARPSDMQVTINVIPYSCTWYRLHGMVLNIHPHVCHQGGRGRILGWSGLTSLLVPFALPFETKSIQYSTWTFLVSPIAKLSLTRYQDITSHIKPYIVTHVFCGPAIQYSRTIVVAGGICCQNSRSCLRSSSSSAVYRTK